MRRLTILLLFYMNVFIGCKNAPKNDDGNGFKSSAKYLTMDYKGTIDTIEKKVVDLTAASDLLTVDEFVNVFGNSTVYKEDAMRFISNSVNSERKRMIAVFSMQNLPDSLYFDFCSSIVDLFIKGTVTENLLITALFHSLINRHQIIKNYNNPAVVSLLNKVKTHTQNDDLKNSIEAVLSGKTLNKLKNFNDNN